VARWSAIGDRLATLSPFLMSSCSRITNALAFFLLPLVLSLRRSKVTINRLRLARLSNVVQRPLALGAAVQGTGADSLKLALVLLWERRGECPGAVPVLVCHDEVVIECAAEQAADAKAWLEKAMIEGMDAVLNLTDEVHVPVEVETRIVRSWAEEG
jgi:DNA polymerase I-like protein with 3'-5' exonuclease and polymerase domains